MNAQLKPLQFAITRPRYDNAHIERFGQWSRDNDAALRTYYIDLGRSLPDPDGESGLAESAKAQRFIAFMKVQWDRERGVFV